MRDKNLIQLYITNMCNSHCKTCTIWQNKVPEELSVAQIWDIVRSDKTANFVIGGGEAILHSQIEAVLQMLADERVNYTLLSNAINLKRLTQLITRYEVPGVTVSCDGINHDKIRGAMGNLDNIRVFVRWAQTYHVPFKLSYTYSAYNEGTFVQDMEFFKSIGVDKIYFCLAQEMALLHSDGKSQIVAHNFEQILDYKDMLFDKDVRFIENMLSGKKPKCDSQSTVFTVYSNGDIVRCQSFMSAPPIGNICTMSFADYLKGAENIVCPYDGECNLLCQRRYDLI